MANSTKTVNCRVGTAHQSRLCHCERSEAISLHHSLFLAPPLGVLWRHSIFTTTFAFLLVLFLIASPAYAKYGGGTGEPNDPYLIFDANQMNAIGADSNDWDKHFKLMADIDLSAFTGTSFNIIGNEDNPFHSVFDGNGHTISNFTYTSTDTDYIGIFGYVTGEIKDLGLIDPNVDAGTENLCVGSLVGFIEDGTIANCYVEGGSVSGDRHVGGLVGINDYGTITNCYFSGSVSVGGGEWVTTGGLVGANAGTISNCYSTGGVEGEYLVGGLVGMNWSRIANCDSTSSVTGVENVGGMVGWSDGTITNCYSNGSVTGVENVGGLVGINWSRIANCDSTSSVSGNEGVGGLVGSNYYDSTLLSR